MFVHVGQPTCRLEGRVADLGCARRLPPLACASFQPFPQHATPTANPQPSCASRQRGRALNVAKSGKRRWHFALDAPLVALIAGLLVLTTLLHATPPDPSRQLPDVELASSRVPTLSGADPLFPPNHTMDGKLTSKGSLTNADFSASSTNVGTPATNATLEAPENLAVAVPNGNVSTGTLASWTATAGVTTASDTPHGTYAKWTSTGASLTSQNAHHRPGQCPGWRRIGRGFEE